MGIVIITIAIALYCCRYGCHLKLLSSQKDAKEKLSQLIKKSALYLQHQRMDHTGTWLRILFWYINHTLCSACSRSILRCLCPRPVGKPCLQMALLRPVKLK